MKFVNIMDVPFLHTDQADFVNLLANRIEQKEKTFVITANPEVVMVANEDPAFMEIIHEATYVTADGIGVVKAAAMLGESLPGRVTGYDTMIALLEIGNEKNWRISLLGASKETIELATKNIAKTYPNIEIVTARDGYFDWNDPTIATEIADAKPDMTFVALGVPRQEKWLSAHLSQFETGLFIGVGGSFDVIAGTVKRAPVIWQKMNLEWLYRLLKQPSRFKRMLVLPQFVLAVKKIQKAQNKSL